MNEAEPTAEGHAAAAELAALRAASPPQPPGGAGAADAPPTAKPKPPTAIQVEIGAVGQATVVSRSGRRAAEAHREYGPVPSSMW